MYPTLAFMEDRFVPSPKGLGFLLHAHPWLKPWAVTFRARGARVVPVLSSIRVPQKAGPSTWTEVLGRDENAVDSG